MGRFDRDEYKREIQIGRAEPALSVSERAARIAEWENRPEKDVFDELMHKEVRLADENFLESAQDLGGFATERAA